LVGVCNFGVFSAIIVADLAILFVGFLMDLRENGLKRWHIRRTGRDIRETGGERLMLYGGVCLIVVLVLYWFGILGALLSFAGCW
jgi:hypothetical protein